MSKNSKSTKTAKVAKSAKATPVAKAQQPAELAPVVAHVTPARPMSKAAAQYHARREAGVCVKCGAELAEGSKLLCVNHLAYYNNWHAAKKEKVATMAARVAELEAKVAAAATPAKKSRKTSK
jgi:hypothetical protein